MPTVFNLSNGALIASNNAAKAQRDFTKSIAKLSTGKRAMFGSILLTVGCRFRMLNQKVGM